MKRFYLLLCLPLLSACAIFGGASEASRPGDLAVLEPTEAERAAQLERGLSPRTLEPGACGLFFWNKTRLKEFTFFQEATSSKAAFFLDGEETVLNLVDTRGDVFGQFNTQSIWQRGADETYTLSFKPGELLEGGQRADDALLSIEDAEGWQTKIPLAGVRACKPG